MFHFPKASIVFTTLKSIKSLEWCGLLIHFVVYKCIGSWQVLNFQNIFNIMQTEQKIIVQMKIHVVIFYFSFRGWWWYYRRYRELNTN